MCNIKRCGCLINMFQIMFFFIHESVASGTNLSNENKPNILQWHTDRSVLSNKEDSKWFSSSNNWYVCI